MARTRLARRMWRRGMPQPASGGQSLVEFALVIPVFLLLLSGMIDFGSGLYANQTIINAAREGARVGVTSLSTTNDNPSAVVARVKALATSLDLTQLTVTVTCVLPAGTACPNNVSGYPAWASSDSVVVKVDYSYKMIWPIALGTTFPLSTTVQMRIE
jgi:Flp pilus assembly protein TadG